MQQPATDFSADIESIQKISAVDTILEVICKTTGMRFAAVARVTRDRWIACATRDEINFGLVPGGELKVETTICDEIEKSHQAVVIDNVSEDENYRDHHTPKMYGLQSYISVPLITRKGEFFGTLCAIDPEPAEINNAKVRGMFAMFADLIAFHLDVEQQIAQSKDLLQDEKHTAELREQFIAVLAHDLRNPISASLNGTQFLLKMPLEEDVAGFVKIINKASYRMKDLVDNMMDFAKARMGGGLNVEFYKETTLNEILAEIIEEVKLVHPEAVIESDLQMNCPVNCDRVRIGQLFTNLLGNAIHHGIAGEIIKVKAITNDGNFELSVSNKSAPITEAAIKHLFKPFFRAAVDKYKQGLGLGLYISKEIADAHNGTLEVVSNENSTTFIFSFPCAS